MHKSIPLPLGRTFAGWFSDCRVLGPLQGAWIRSEACTRHCSGRSRDLGRRSARNRDLLTVALPILDELQALVQDLGFLTLLTDSDGVILKMLSGASLRDAGSEGNLSLGGIWREEQAGTGAIGLVLRLGQPVQVVGTEHFFERDHDLTCCAPDLQS